MIALVLRRDVGDYGEGSKAILPDFPPQPPSRYGNEAKVGG